MAKGKKGNKRQEDSDEETVPAVTNDEVDDEEFAASIKKKQNKKPAAKKAPTGANAFALLNDEDDNGDDLDEPVQKKGKKQTVDDEDEDITPKKQQPQKKGKKKGGNDDYLAQMAEAQDELESEEPIVADIAPKGKKQDKKKKKNDSDYLSQLDQGEDEQEPVVEADIAPKKQQQKGKNKKKGNDDDYLAQMAQEQEDWEKKEEEEQIKPKKNQKSNKKDDDDDEVADIAPKKQQQKGKNKKKGNDDDYLAQLAQEQEEEKPEEEQPKKQDQKSQKKKDNKKKGNDDDYLAQMAQDQEEMEQEQPEKDQEAKDKKKEKKEKQKLKKEQEKKEAEQKKQEQKAKKDDKKDEKKEKKEKQEKPAAKARPMNARVAELKRLQEERKAEEERIRLEQERRQKEEEARVRALLEEEERREKEIREKNRLEKERRRLEEEAQRKAEEESKRNALIEQYKAMGLISAFADAPAKKGGKKKTSAKKNTKKSTDKKEKKEEKKVEKKETDGNAVEDQDIGDDWENALADDAEKESKSAQVEKASENTTTTTNNDEDDDEDDWEKALDEPVKKPEPVKEAVKKPEPVVAAAKSTPTTTTTTTSSKKKAVVEEEDEEQEWDPNLRSPICCVLGHVDTGKTKILDKIRNTNVQGGEAGGITQQIGATFVPMSAIKQQTKALNDMTGNKLQYKVPALLIIDTPGHESFTNLRSRGSSLCDIAILVVDIMHGLERQTLESLGMLKQRKTPFVVALNKIDAMYGWKPIPNSPVQVSLKSQQKHVIEDYESRVKGVITQFAEQGMNAVLYYKNKDFSNYVSLVPTSAITGEGIPDLLALMVQLTQKHMVKKITFQTKIQCTILEVKVVEGYGTTIDVVLVNGLLREGDTIVVCGLNGPIVTTIRSLLTPKPLREIRVKGEYLHHKELRAAQGIKISAQNLDGAVPGSGVLVAKPGDSIEMLKDEVMADLNDLLSRVSTQGKGVSVQSSTLGSLEALLSFLESEKIPVSAINIGPVHKKDIMRASVMLDSAPEYAVMLAFDVAVSKDAQEEAEKMGVTVFTANIIYHLFDRFKEHMAKVLKEKQNATANEAIWPCVIRVIPENVFHKSDPITVGVDVLDGILRVGTPLAVRGKDGEYMDIGRIKSIEHNKVKVDEAEKGKAVAVQIDSTKVYGRHFDHTDQLVSKISRASIDKLKELFGEQLQQRKDLLQLLVKLKKMFSID